MTTESVTHQHRSHDPSRREITLNNGTRLTMTSHVPRDVSQRRMAVASAQLYVFTGLLCQPYQPPTNVLASYTGISAGLFRADASYRRWVVMQRRLHPTGMALMHAESIIDRDQLLYVEARLIQNLSALHNIATLNTQSAANLAGTRMRRQQVIDGMALAEELSTHIHRELFGGRTNPATADTGNSRLAAIRVIRAADRALDIADLTERLTAAHWHPNASTPGRSIRRDITQRLDRGQPHIHVAWHRHQRLWFHPGLTKHEAIRRYDRAKPLRR